MRLSGRTHFIYTAEEAVLYDTVIEREIPCYHELHRVIRDVFPYDDTIQELRYLELGIGTGNLTKYIIEAHANIRVDGYDISHQMLEIAHSKLQNYSEVSFSNNYHVASIFLCEDQERIFTKDFLSRIYHSLLSKGVFIVCCSAKIPEDSIEYPKTFLNTRLWAVRVLWENSPFMLYEFRKL
jgi:SAM-dependent methyltransferase